MGAELGKRSGMRSCSEPDSVVVPVAAPATREQDGGWTSGNTSNVEPGSTIVTLAPKPDMVEEEYPQDDQRGTPELLPKHKIFLSHSGSQKPLVEQLCVDLENAKHCPFFDQRDDSLPKGEKFPELIQEAAQNCEVAVVVLSHEFLTSKWPMLELVTFVEAQQSSNPNLKIVPLFYKLRVSEFKEQLENKQLMAKWREFEAKDPRIDPKKWIGAVGVLCSINGEEFAKYGGSEVAYRRAIVASICRHSRPELSFNVAAMQGRKRLCDIIVRKLMELRNNQAGVGPATLGLHGMSGMGKTLICKALCNYFHSEYAGRVCHAEFQTNGDTSQVFQKIMRDLTDINEGLLLRATDIYQFEDLLKIWLPKRPVFLALDNVLDVHLTALRQNIRLILESVNPESTVIFTSRSLEIVEAFVGSKALCQSVPSLEKAEALNILLQSAAPNRPLSSVQGQEMDILEMCINRCMFSTTNRSQDSSIISAENERYHPLALMALGSYLRDIHPSEPLQWHEKLSVSGQWPIFHKHSVFDMLRTGYDTLPTALDKLFYMDIALFAPRQKLYSLRKLCDWLQGIHNLSEEAIMYKLRLLGKKSLLELCELEETTRVVVHDLYLEFAEYEIQSEDTKRWCVYQRGAEMLPNCLESSPPGSHWPDLVRICFLEKPKRSTTTEEYYPFDRPKAGLRFSGEKLSEWANLQVLCIHSLALKHLDIGALKCLRSLDLQSGTLETLTWSSNMAQLRFVKLDCKHLSEGPSFEKCLNLEELATGVSKLQQVFLPCPTSFMKVLDLTGWHGGLSDVLEVEHMTSLQELKIVGSYFYRTETFSISGLSSLSDLRSLVLNGLPIRGSLLGLEGLISLQRLTLNGCHKIQKLPNFSRLTKLEVLDVSSTGIEDLEGVEKLPQLRGLYCVGCWKLRSLPDLRSSPTLREVFTQNCGNLSRQPAVSEACTLVTTFAEEIIGEFYTFLEFFREWSRGKSSFQSVLSVCPTRPVSKNMALALIEADQAFVDACTVMHGMAALGRTEQGFDAEKDSAICSRLISLVTDPHATNFDLRALRKEWHHFNPRTLL